MIQLTPLAAEMIQAAAIQGGMEGMALRLAAKELEDGSLQFGMGFDEEREHDMRLESAGVDLLVSRVSAPYFQGVVLDFVQSDAGAHFIFVQPEDATPSGGCGSGCGCGSGGASPRGGCS
jgi:iron-sulfur cluster assembly protein